MRRVPRELFCLAFALSAHAGIVLPHILTDHMVVQRGFPVHLWGSASPGEQVSVQFRGETRATQADTAGQWSVFFPPGDAGGPFDLDIRGQNTITLHDVLVGEVWIASGQSNMEFPLLRADDAPGEIAAANFPRIRLLTVDRETSDYPLPDMTAKPWTACTPDSISHFSAVAYYFARHLQDKLNGVPIGLIESNWGGTPAEAWTSLPALSADAGLMPVYSSWAGMMQSQSRSLAARAQQLAKWEAAGKKGDRPWSPNEDNSWKPGGLYNAMIAPLTPFAIRGAIWYQGESNASKERASLYERLFQTMIRDWRANWGEGDFPFLFVQLADYTAGNDGSWPTVREAQRQALGLTHTGMAVTIDIGNPKDIHPKNKKDVGTRLALAALAIAYHQKLEYSGPLFRQATPEGNAIRVWFDHATRLSGATKGFEVAGADRKFKPAEARIVSQNYDISVLVSSPEVPSPVYVRYGWSDVPDCCLVNSDHLPASPFSSL